MRKILLASLLLTLVLFSAPTIAKAQAGTPTIALSSPTNGETVSATSVSVSGTGSGLPNNTINVQALDAHGGVLGEQTVTLDTQEAGGAGNWSATLALSVAPGTAGQIVALAPPIPGAQSPAIATVSVVYGEAAPTAAPTEEPTAVPTVAPTEEPTAIPTVAPTEEPTLPPTVAPTEEPTEIPTVAPTAVPTEAPTQAPTSAPTVSPTSTVAPTLAPTEAPTNAPTVAPTTQPTAESTTESTATPTLLPTATNESVATPTPTLMPTEEPTAGAESTASIAIMQPAEGAIVNPQQIQIVGNASGLPTNNVIVQARKADGTILAQVVTLVSGNMGDSGKWQVALAVNVPLGTAGNIYAFGLAPDTGALLAEDQINVTYGEAPNVTATPTATATPQPKITIDQPENGSIVDPNQVQVSGSGSAIPGNNVIVRALDAGGYILAEQATTISGSSGGTGNWTVMLNAHATPGSTGSIVAYAIDPASGLVLTNDRIRVTYGQPPTPIPAMLQINQPTEGATVDAGNGFVVSGVSAGLPTTTIVVQLYNTANQIIYQTVTSSGSSGQWSVAIRMYTATGTPARIWVFSPSPVNGQPLVADQVNVTLSSPCQVRTDWYPYVVQPGDTIYSIAQSIGVDMATLIFGNCLTDPNVISVGQILYIPSLPAPGIVPATPAVTVTVPTVNGALPVVGSAIVTGSSSWTQPGTLMVRALDNMGKVLDEKRATALGPAVNGLWQWQAQLNLADAVTGTFGTLFAYVPTTQGNLFSAYQAIPVIYGGDQSLPYISIQSPSPYAALSLDKGVAVSGAARGISSGFVTVQALDDAGNILAQLPTIVQSAQPGGPGTWVVTLPVTWIGHGKIVVSANDATSGALITQAAVAVLFGAPSSQSSYVHITYPLPDTLLRSSNDLVAVAGYAGGLITNTVYLSALDASNRVRFVIPVTVDLATGKWVIIPSSSKPFTEDGAFAIFAAATQPSTGEIIASDRINLRIQRPTVNGQVVISGGVAPPTNTTLSLSIVGMPVNSSQQQETLTQQTIVMGTQTTVPFALPYDPALVDPTRLYLLAAEIDDANGAALYTSRQPIAVITQGAPTTGVEVIVEPVQQ